MDPVARKLWDDWFGFWRNAGLAMVAPWDDAFGAFRERTEFLPRRMAALGLDAKAFSGAQPFAFVDLQRRCMACDSPEQCEWDLGEAPADPAWRDYCPNATTLTAIAESKRKPHGESLSSRKRGRSRSGRPELC